MGDRYFQPLRNPEIFLPVSQPHFFPSRAPPPQSNFLAISCRQKTGPPLTLRARPVPYRTLQRSPDLGLLRPLQHDEQRTHPTSCIGVPWQPGLNLQITPKGNLFTNLAELALFWGPDNKPLACRQRQFLDGWIPVVGDTWTNGGINYRRSLVRRAPPTRSSPTPAPPPPTAPPPPAIP